MEDNRSSRGSLQQLELVDDECSTDSGCSSGGSTGSAGLPSRRGSASQSCYSERLRARSGGGGGGGGGGGSGSGSQERVRHRSVPRVRCTAAQLLHGTPSSYSEPEQLRKRSSSTARRLRKAFQSLKISTRLEPNEQQQQQPTGKKSIQAQAPQSQQSQQSQQQQQQQQQQKRILRSPVTYTYVKGLSGLPTQRVPRSAV